MILRERKETCSSLTDSAALSKVRLWKPDLSRNFLSKWVALPLSSKWRQQHGLLLKFCVWTVSLEWECVAKLDYGSTEFHLWEPGQGHLGLWQTACLRAVFGQRRLVMLQLSGARSTFRTYKQIKHHIEAVRTSHLTLPQWFRIWPYPHFGVGSNVRK